jgi:hypothetical protein
MLGKWWIPLAGLALASGSLALAVPAAAAALVPAAAPSWPAFQPGGVLTAAGPGTRPLAAQGGSLTATKSSNWSGYAAHGKTYTKVSAHWTEPKGTCPGGSQYSSFWVGLDGYQSKTVEQTGSEVDCHGTSPRYYSWYEMYPASPHVFASPVRPGDHFFGSVTYQGGGHFTLVLADATRGWRHTIHATLSSAKRSSAEVITEAPCCTSSGGILPLAHFSPVTFSSADVNGKAIGSFSPTKIIMVDGGGRLKDSVSSLSGGAKFTVTWLRSN